MSDEKNPAHDRKAGSNKPTEETVRQAIEPYVHDLSSIPAKSLEEMVKSTTPRTVADNIRWGAWLAARKEEIQESKRPGGWAGWCEEELPFTRRQADRRILYYRWWTGEIEVDGLDRNDAVSVKALDKALRRPRTARTQSKNSKSTASGKKAGGINSYVDDALRALVEVLDAEAADGQQADMARRAIKRIARKYGLRVVIKEVGA